MKEDSCGIFLILFVVALPILFLSRNCVGDFERANKIQCWEKTKREECWK